MKAQEREWSLVGLALSCVLAAIALCLRSDNPLLQIYTSRGVSPFFIYGFLFGVMVLCGAIVLFARDEKRHRWLSGVGLVAASLGVVLALLSRIIPITMSAVGSGVLLGFGLMCLLCCWGYYYRSLTFRGVLLNAALSFLVAACLWFVVVHAETPLLFCLGMLVLVVCGGFPLFAHQGALTDETGVASRSEVSEHSTVTMYQTLRWGWAATLGLMFNFFTIGLTFWPEEAGLGSPALSPKPLAYAVLAMVVWWIVVRARQEGGEAIEVFYRTSLPIAAAIMLAFPFIETVGHLSGSFVLSVVSYLGVAVCNVLGFVMIFWTAKNFKVDFSKIFAAFCVACSASMALGMIMFQMLGKSAQVVSLCLLAAYLVVMVLSEIKVGAAHQRAARETECDFVDRACKSLSEQYGLSVREAEVLAFLARGRGAKHIADKLCISPETVRTHCKRMYDKMDVHTKEELLDLIESFE